jgi:hypothetical protein
MILSVRQQLDPSRLQVLSEDARDAADESGELDGNQHYLDLSAASWADVAYALEAEAILIQRLAGFDNPQTGLQRFDEERDVDDEREALWYLELGVAAPVLALNALGAHTVLSCNGGAFGGQHLREVPSICFYPQTAGVDELLALARESGVGLVEEEGRALLYAPDVQGLQRFAALALERHRGL